MVAAANLCVDVSMSVRRQCLGLSEKRPRRNVPQFGIVVTRQMFCNWRMKHGSLPTGSPARAERHWPNRHRSASHGRVACPWLCMDMGETSSNYKSNDTIQDTCSLMRCLRLATLSTTILSMSQRKPSTRKRKTCKRYNVAGDAHGLTFNCFHRQPFRPCPSKAMDMPPKMLRDLGLAHVFPKRWTCYPGQKTAESLMSFSPKIYAPPVTRRRFAQYYSCNDN
jgi:hypothetical protein